VPNPSLGSVRINYALPAQSKVILKIYNSVGQLVRTAVNTDQEPGYYAFTWDGRDDTGRNLAAGIYFYHFSANEYESTRKSVLLK
jgi:flagellar hook assembly protein FlgD